MAGAEAQGFFAAYVPGSTALIYPEGYAKKLPKGCDLRFQIHYTPNGKATTDQTKIGLVFAKEKPRYEVRVSAAVNPVFVIPPGADNHKAVRSVPDHSLRLPHPKRSSRTLTFAVRRRSTN